MLPFGKHGWTHCETLIDRSKKTHYINPFVAYKDKWNQCLQFPVNLVAIPCVLM
jgi:hypothetical protein